MPTPVSVGAALLSLCKVLYAAVNTAFAMDAAFTLMLEKLCGSLEIKVMPPALPSRKKPS